MVPRTTPVVGGWGGGGLFFAECKLFIIHAYKFLEKVVEQ